MTSMERTNGNIYGGIVEPAHSIVSYTWGRWQLPYGSPALLINGFSWSTPAVGQAHFSVSELQEVIHRICLKPQSHEYQEEPIHFVWIDVACIDQIDERIKSDEIGRQAAVFKNATYAYVWLNHLKESDLEAFHNTLYDGSDIIDVHSDIKARVNPLSRALEVLLLDPWFSSLWTLQEMYLRPEAVILSKAGQLVARRGGNGNPLTLANIITRCSIVYEALTNRALNQTHDQESESAYLLSIIEKLGLYGGPWNNPVLLTGAAQYRQTREPKDRVYGIMQVYGFKLGASVEPSKSFTLEDLELQLAAAHNRLSPLSAQIFVHTRIVELGKSWKIDSMSRVPPLLLLTESDWEDQCAVSFEHPRSPTFVGKGCLLTKLVNIWEITSSQVKAYAVQTLLLDTTAFSLEHVPSTLHDLPENDSRQHDLGHLLVNAFGDDVPMLLLGRMIDGADKDIDMIVGLIVRRRYIGSMICWQRIGICF